MAESSAGLVGAVIAIVMVAICITSKAFSFPHSRRLPFRLHFDHPSPHFTDPFSCAIISCHSNCSNCSSTKVASKVRHLLATPKFIPSSIILPLALLQSSSSTLFVSSSYPPSFGRCVSCDNIGYMQLNVNKWNIKYH
jgi:hypothetical protein